MGRMSPRARPGSQAVTDAKPDKQENRLSVTPGAVNLVTTHPPDSRHPRHGVQELLPTRTRRVLAYVHQAPPPHERKPLSATSSPPLLLTYPPN
jgi:hypothetical protein